MSLDYIWEGINAKPTVPYSPATGLDYVSSRATKTKPGVWVPVGGQSFQTNSVPNAIQSIENLIAGSNVVLTPDEMGGTTISSLGGAASFEGVVIIDGVIYTTIQAGINALPPAGGTVFVPNIATNAAPWTLSSVLTINKPCHLIFDVGTLTCAMADPGITSGAINITANHVIIEGQGALTVITQPNAQNIQVGIQCGAQSYITVKKILLDWNDVNQTNAAGFYSGIRSKTGASNLRVCDCDITRGGDRGIDFRGSSIIWIEDNFFYNTGLMTFHSPSYGNSVSVDVDGTAQSTDVWLVNNQVNIQGDSFAAAHCARVHIIGNTIRGAADFGQTPTVAESGIDASSSVDAEIIGNSLINVGGPQLYTDAAAIVGVNYIPRNIVISGNKFVANVTGHGLPANDPRVNIEDFTVPGQPANVIISNNAFDGVRLSVIGVTGLVLSDNIFNNVLSSIASGIAVILDQQSAGVMADFSVQDNIWLSDQSTTKIAIVITAAVTTPGTVIYFGNLIDSAIPNGLENLSSVVKTGSNIDALRILGAGTQATGSNVTLSGWGSGASLYATYGTDLAAQISITCGTSPSANPTVKYTFADGSWGAETSPVVVLSRTDGAPPAATWQIFTITGTSVTFLFMGTPNAAAVYGIAFICIGQSV